MSPSITSASPVENADVRPLDRRIVKIVEIIEGGDGMARPQKPSNDMGTDEACATGDKDFHRVRLIGVRKRRQGISTFRETILLRRSQMSTGQAEALREEPWRTAPFGVVAA